jgi:dihydroneopterin aldolase/D-erythro-7,8-dihydroneopterin triphosphate epimerase
MVEGSRFHLAEALAERIADICLENEAVQQVQVTVEKPSALRFARSVGVEITRDRT